MKEIKYAINETKELKQFSKNIPIPAKKELIDIRIIFEKVIDFV